MIEKDASTPLTKRHLSFDDLITHLKHYNAATRKDAILGMRELLETHWNLLESNFTPLVNAVVRLIGDEVRLPGLPFSGSATEYDTVD